MSPASESLRFRRIVAKFGTNVLTGGTDRLDPAVMADLVGQVARLHARGAQVAIVTSGAIAAGRQAVRAASARGARPPASGGPLRQVYAAVGQGRLLHTYDTLFSWHGLTVAQALLTRRDLADRDGYLHARNTLIALLEMGIVPIVNENDAVATDEIAGAVIGDNDNLSALVATLVDADLLAMCTTTGGLYTADPARHPEARLVGRVEQIDEQVERMAGAAGERGIGGMVTKLQAARMATAAGITAVIVSGRETDVLVRLGEGEEPGTWFLPQTDRPEARKRWILSGLALGGRIVVDAGAARALREGGGSLLPAGAIAADGEFDRGDAVTIMGPDGDRIACGISNYRAADVQRIRGLQSDRIAHVLGYDYGAEIVHRNNLVML